MEYEVSDSLLKGLVSLLRPAKEDLIRKPEILDGKKNLILTSHNYNQSILPNIVIIYIRLKVFCIFLDFVHVIKLDNTFKYFATMKRINLNKVNYI